MDSNSIFISNTSSNDISGKITLTNVLNVIPPDSLEKPIDNWKLKYKTEWRWRILELISENISDNDREKQSDMKSKKNKTRRVVEISYIKYDSNKRIYFNRYGEWVERNIDPIYDKFVTKQYFYYTTN